MLLYSDPNTRRSIILCFMRRAHSGTLLKCYLRSFAFNHYLHDIFACGMLGLFFGECAADYLEDSSAVSFMPVPSIIGGSG